MYVAQETTPKLLSLTLLSNFLNKASMDFKDLMTTKNKISVQANELFYMTEFPNRHQNLIHTHFLPLNIFR